MSEQNRKTKVKQSEFIKFPGHALVSITDKRYEIFAGNGRIELKMCSHLGECICPRGSARLNKMVAKDGSFEVKLTNIRRPRKITFKQHRDEIIADAKVLHKKALKLANRMKREERARNAEVRKSVKEYEEAFKAELNAFLGR